MVALALLVCEMGDCGHSPAGDDDCAGWQVDDVMGALDWFGRQPGVDAGGACQVGFSRGGQVALLAAARDAPVQLQLIPGAEHGQDIVLRPQIAIDFFAAWD